VLTRVRAEVDLRVPPELNTHFYISYCMIARDMTRPTRAAEPCRPRHYHFLRPPSLPLPPRRPPRLLSQADVALNAIPNRKVEGKEVSMWHEMQVLRGLNHSNIVLPISLPSLPPSPPPLPLPHDACTYACHRLLPDVFLLLRSDFTSGSSRGQSTISFSNSSLGHWRRALQAA
jgi:hypothetical protein